mgnify:CR=1 FL=1|tara:strand:+ start:11558 stop:12538 length:981 start_codon:yes stop_codon:yes gene_type:complete
MEKIIIIGGAGYVGCELTQLLLNTGYEVTVFDLMIYGEDKLPTHSNLTKIKGDVRDIENLKNIIPGHNTLIHLACISNDPSFELNPNLGKSINYDSFLPIVNLSKKSKIKKFIYASSSSVYGVKDENNVTEDLSLEPLTDYSKFKAMCEKILLENQSSDFITTILRPATVCGYSSRQRLDVIVNIFTNLAFNKNLISVFGGDQLRPNIHIKDMTRAYLHLLQQPNNKIDGKIFNAGYENKSVIEIASLVKNSLNSNVELKIEKSNDNRSYHVSSEKIKNELGFVSKFTIEDAVLDLINAFRENKFIDPLNNSIYYNIKKMQSINLK